MKNYPTISLLISTYNWPEALKFCLDSVLYQTVLPDEVIIADDGSTEETKDLIDLYRKDFPVPLIHVWHEDKGFQLAAIRNKAIASAKYSYVIQIDGDIILNKNFIKDHLSFSEQGYFVSGSRVLMTKGLSDKIFEGKVPALSISVFMTGVSNKFNALRSCVLRNFLKNRYKKNNPIYVKGCNMAFWRADLLAINGYNEDITGWGAEDNEIACRLLKKGVKRHFIKFGAVEYHIYHPSNDKSNSVENYKLLDGIMKSGDFYAKNGLDKYI